jgi:hypothetical protein
LAYEDGGTVLMAAGDLITADGQIEMRGLLIGSGTDFLISDDGIDGFGTTDLRTSDVARPQAHGLFQQRTWLGQRDIDFEILVVGDTQAEVLTNLQTLGEAFAPASSTEAEALALRVGGSVFLAYGRPDKTAADVSLIQSGLAKVKTRFVATDPLLYDATENADSSGGASVTGGHGYPHAYPHGYGTVVSGSIAATNAGNFETYGTATITGPCTNPTVTLIETGETLSCTITVEATDSLVIDFKERTVTLNGTASRSNTVDRPGSTWFALAPGVNTVQFSQDSGSGSMSWAWRDAWLF